MKFFLVDGDEVIVSDQNNGISQRPFYTKEQQEDNVVDVLHEAGLGVFPENYRCLPVSSSQTGCGNLRCQADELGLNPVDSRGPLQKLKGRQKNNCVGIQENYLWPQIMEMITGDERVCVFRGWGEQ